METPLQSSRSAVARTDRGWTTSEPSVDITAAAPLACGAAVWRFDGALRVTVVIKAAFALVPGGRRDQQVMMAGYARHVGFYPSVAVMTAFADRLAGSTRQVPQLSAISAGQWQARARRSDQPDPRRRRCPPPGPAMPASAAHPC